MRLQEISQRQALLIAAGILALLAVGGRLLTPGHADTIMAPIQPETTATSTLASEVVVHVAGAVRSPGLYRLDGGSRVDDAIEAAGGAVAKADLDLINIAAPLIDGQQVLVPLEPSAQPAGASASTSPSGSAQAVIHLNTASLDELEEIPGVGPSTAQKIIDYRDEHGPFTSVDQLDEVSGIGPSKLEEMRDHVAP